MKLFSYVLVTGLSFFLMTGRSAETANARIWCWSLRFQEGSDSFGNTLDLSTINGAYNGELAPYQGDTYASGFALDFSGLPITGVLNVNLPPVVDANGNGFDDFFEVSQGVETIQTSGTYQTQLGGGSVGATWSRSAGSKDGTCVLHLIDNAYGDLGDYKQTFEVIEYTGPLSYTPGSNAVSGSVNLVKTGDPSSLLQGGVQFVKVQTNRFNQLVLQAGNWTNASMQTLMFLQDIYDRDSEWPTNYYGYFDFRDGDLSTADNDYTLWELSIDDLNDANHNGIPDFSDDPSGGTLPRAPQLALTTSATNLLLTIHGDVGRTHTVQELNSLKNTNWQVSLSVTLTNDPQVVSLPRPTESTHFWRVVAK